MEKQFNVVFEEIKKFDVYVDSIELSYHLRKFSELFCKTVCDKECLSDLMQYLNEHALDDSKFAVNMAVVFSSIQLADVVVNGHKLRNEMVGILQQNFQNINKMKAENIMRFYNSVTLLGEYYNRKRMASGGRIHILGQSLLLLLTTELENDIQKCIEDNNHVIDPEFAKLILSQITLNGISSKTDHKQEISDLTFSIRKCLIHVPNLQERAKAFLLMTLDLYYSNFQIVGDLLNKLYGKYLLDHTADVSKLPCDKASTNKETSESPISSTEKEKSNSLHREETNASASKEQKESNVQETPKPVDEKESKTSVQETPKTVDEKESKTSDPAENNVPDCENTNNGVKEDKSTTLDQEESNTSDRKENNGPVEKKEIITPDQKEVSTPPPLPPPSKSKQGNAPKESGMKPKSPKKDESHQDSKENETKTQDESHPEKNGKNVTKSNLKEDNHKNSDSNSGSSTILLNGNSDNILKQNGNSQNNCRNIVKPKVEVSRKAYFKEENVENLTWDALNLDDEVSPQKLNPHAKSFLTFLANK